MKIRKDFVTNSSSSSFIVSRNDVTRDKLIEILLEIANMEHEYRDDDERFTIDDIIGNCVAYRYNIREATPERPYALDYYLRVPETFDNHFIVDNDDCGRYNWNVVREVLDKYNIPWEHGYCD